jgi:hypothetical protein
MKIIRYGKGMKLKKGYLTECGCCHTIFLAAPTDVEFLWKNDDPVEFPTPTYRTYCPVCGDTRIYQVKDDEKKKKHRKPKISVIVLFIILLILDVITIFTVPFTFGGNDITVSRVIAIILLMVYPIIHTFCLCFSDIFEKDE